MLYILRVTLSFYLHPVAPLVFALRPIGTNTDTFSSTGQKVNRQYETEVIGRK